MSPKRLFVVGVALAVVSCGAGSEATTFSAADDAAALTSGAGDKLFTLTFTKFPQSYAISDVTISAALAGMTQTAVNFVHNDSNANNQLDEGESLLCSEPPVNVFDATGVNKAIEVMVSVKQAGTTTLSGLGSTTWTPAN